MKNMTTEEEIKWMKSMMISIFTYGTLAKDNYYLKDYKKSLGLDLFNKTYDSYAKHLTETYRIEKSVYTDSEGCTYNSLKPIA